MENLRGDGSKRGMGGGAFTWESGRKCPVVWGPNESRGAMSGTAPVSTLDGWRRAPFAAGGLSYDCYEKGEGPGVVLLPEVPGITPEVIGLGEHLVGEGFTVVMPSLFGVDRKSVV